MNVCITHDTMQTLKALEQIPFEVLVKSQRLALATVLFKYGLLHI